MTLREAAAYIRETVPTVSVLRLYGYEPSRDGFMRCPFHSGDRTASLRVYDAVPSSRRRGWYCFGCHAGGSVLDFVMLHEPCTFADAVRAVDKALGLGLLQPVPWQEEERSRAYRRCLDDLESLFLAEAADRAAALNRELDRDYRAWAALDRIPAAARTAGEWTRWLSLKDSLAYLEYRLERLDSLRKEIREWKNRHLLRQLRPNGASHSRRPPDPDPFLIPAPLQQPPMPSSPHPPQPLPESSSLNLALLQPLPPPPGPTPAPLQLPPSPPSPRSGPRSA